MLTRDVLALHHAGRGDDYTAAVIITVVLVALELLVLRLRWQKWSRRCATAEVRQAASCTHWDADTCVTSTARLLL